MLSPRLVAPISGTPATSLLNRMHRVQWMHRVMNVLTSGPRYLSFTARLFSAYREWSIPYEYAWS